MTNRDRQDERRAGVNDRLSPIAATQGRPLGQRCSCEVKAGAKDVNPTCPVHGHGRPAGTK